MARQKRLKDYGYPSEGIILVDKGGGDDYEMPQEALSARTCGSCRQLDCDWCCKRTGEEKDPDVDYCDDIDYQEEWLDTEYGFRSPVRNEYSSDKAYEQACEAINAINRNIEDEREERW